MANRLKDVFSNDIPEYTSKVRFKDPQSYKNFRAALDTVWQEGRCVEVEGIDRISTYMQLQGIQLPIEQSTSVSKFVIGPSKEKVPFSVVWDDNEKIYNFYRYAINDGVILETEINSVIYMKLVFWEDSEKVNINYKMQFQYAKTVEEIIFEINASISFFAKFCDPLESQNQTGTSEGICEFIEFLRDLATSYSRLFTLQKTLNLTFSIKEIDSMSTEDWQKIEELYLLLCEKVPLKLNAKINSTELLDVESSSIQAEPKVGARFSLVFAQDLSYELLGQKFTIYTANALINAIVKDVKKDGERTTIYYGDTDSQPMYISFSGFLTEEEAKAETSRDIGGEEKYINARTSVQYIKELNIVVE